MLIVLIILLSLFGFGGYRMGPGLGYTAAVESA